ncbi:hypothetical protein [Candidatus Parabeggiatoa sp. HSG14]|uniref:hypothetical protein n=1 Tax=Candidatus Parabeggiatoa sp. HSG14 TaxID=3055593 RepID=UPI0025A86A51|nr:hypothetical protein [Thiotrichales bacterium HSG14]
MKLAELIHDMSKLNLELSDFEQKFGVKSPEFYQAITKGELEEFDYRLEFIEWLSLYKIWLSLNEKYQQLVTRQPIAISIKTTVMSQHEQSTRIAV